ncbi:MAG: beta-galactosidase [Lachnospiraceae bacterium]|nr:beta-galactosidase [Lachnospiraceae bacterium]
MKHRTMNNYGGIIHGGDYNPDQWLDRPEILEEDLLLMKKAKVNCVSLGIFAWGHLEPEEGKYDFGWLEKIIQRLYENDIYTILATPTGAMPQWLTSKYEEVLQVNEYGVRNYPGKRHNYCPSSPVMREKTRQLDTRLAEKFGAHPGVIGWHISNEIGGNGGDSSCHCAYCQDAFRTWLKDRYGSLDQLNAAWWTSFWSHTYTDWDQIKSPSSRGEDLVHGQNLDWKRFVDSQLLDFCKEEIKAVRSHSSLPVTTNMMEFFKSLNYFKWAKELDIVSWDSYPDWHSGADELQTAARAAAAHSLMRSLKKSSFLLMESTPSVVNWRQVNRLKRPGMHELSSLQAVACGSDSVQYFQWRKGRGSSEKYHGAVVDHRNGDDTRVFREVTKLGERLEKIASKVIGTCNRPRIAMVFDWENWWAMEDARAVDNNLNYPSVFLDFFRPLWELGVDVDMVDMEGELDPYSVVVAPLNYMYKKGYVEKVQAFVKQGGCYITTCWSGEVDDSDLTYTGAHPLEDVLGIRTEEIDVPDGYCENSVRYQGADYRITGLCGLVHVKGAAVLAEYQQDFYRGYPALTRNTYGSGEAYYIASLNEQGFLKAFYREILKEKELGCGLQVRLTQGVTVNERSKPVGENGETEKVWFLQNFNREAAVVELLECYENVETGEPMMGKIELKSFECVVLAENKKEDCFDK